MDWYATRGDNDKNNDEENALEHHGILGMKWGVRRFQNPDGSLTAVGKAHYQKLEKKAIDKHYKENLKNGGSFVFKAFRDSTGKNFDEANRKFHESFENDQKYKELSKKAFNAEKERLMAEKKYVNDDEAYMKYLKSTEANELYRKSVEATRAKDAYVAQKAKDYIDVIKEAKVKDLNITENIDLAKKFVSDKWTDNMYYDENLEFNPDNFYDSWVDKEKYK